MSKIPQEVMAHMNDNPHKDSEVVCLQHMLDLCMHAITAYALAHHPDTAKVGESWSPTPEEQVEVNAMLAEVIAEYGNYHKHAWLREVTYTIGLHGQSSIFIPDDHQYTMDYLIALRQQSPDLDHSAIPERVH